MYKNQMETLSSSPCQLRLGVVLRYLSLSPYTTCYCRPAIKIRSCFSWVRGGGIEVAGCSADCCCCCCWNMYGGGSDSGGDSNNDVFLYKKEQSSSSELIASYWLEE